MTAGPQADAAGRGPLQVFDSYPRAAAATAAVGISFAAILFVLSGASPSTATFFRCLYALPLLWRDHIVGWGNLQWRQGALQAELGYVAGHPPREPEFDEALADELARFQAFMEC